MNEFEYCSFLPDRINSNNFQIKMKKKYEFKSVVAETLLIPLYMRAKESRRKDAILRDLQAEQLVESIEYDYSKFDGAKLLSLIHI